MSLTGLPVSAAFGLALLYAVLAFLAVSFWSSRRGTVGGLMALLTGISLALTAAFYVFRILVSVATKFAGQ